MYNCIFDKKVENVKNCVIGVVEQVDKALRRFVLKFKEKIQLIKSTHPPPRPVLDW